MIATIYSVILVGSQWQVFRDGGDEQVAEFAHEQEAVDWCREDALGEEQKILVYQGEICGD